VEFVTNLQRSAAAVKAALAKEWNATGGLKNPPLEEIQKLALEKYSTREWNFKFRTGSSGREPPRNQGAKPARIQVFTGPWLASCSRT
jgi:hypothetical protein